jgi:hypothetical protein
MRIVEVLVGNRGLLVKVGPLFGESRFKVHLVHRHLFALRLLRSRADDAQQINRRTPSGRLDNLIPLVLRLRLGADAHIVSSVMFSGLSSG